MFKMQFRRFKQGSVIRFSQGAAAGAGWINSIHPYRLSTTQAPHTPTLESLLREVPVLVVVSEMFELIFRVRNVHILANLRGRHTPHERWKLAQGRFGFLDSKTALAVFILKTFTRN